MQKITREFIRTDLQIPANEDGTFDDVEFEFYQFCKWIIKNCGYSVIVTIKDLFGGEFFLFQISYQNKKGLRQCSGNCKFNIERTMRIGREYTITKTGYAFYDLLKPHADKFTE